MRITNVGELLTLDGAEALARKIRSYWVKRGFSVDTHIEAMGTDETWRGQIFCIRSDMVNGMPIRRFVEGKSPGKMGVPEEDEAESVETEITG